ncbi:hypothetical protein [Legionella tunisiensis]|uniref:hypothetical protein n=1 Tax=Legionella tunisiensis TaxID=1034944 RepID=UPI0002F47D38|nr:hypothetical protein [Legionella tunisiensis]
MDDSTSSDWIYQELVKDQFNKALQGKTLDTAIIFTAFSKGKNIWNASYGSLTLAEQAVVESYRSKNPKLLEMVVTELGKEKLPIDVDKIVKVMGENDSEFPSWVSVQLEKMELHNNLRSEFLQGSSANLMTIRSLLESGIKLGINLDKDSGFHGLTLGEYVIAQAFITKDSISPDMLAFFFHSVGAKLTPEKLKNSCYF